MFRSVEMSADRIGKTAEELTVAFQGFDGNNEEHHYGFAYFLRRKMGKWEELGKPDEMTEP